MTTRCVVLNLVTEAIPWRGSRTAAIIQWQSVRPSIERLGVRPTEWISVALIGQERLPRPPRQEAKFVLWPGANCRRQNQIWKEGVQLVKTSRRNPPGLISFSLTAGEDTASECKAMLVWSASITHSISNHYKSHALACWTQAWSINLMNWDIVECDVTFVMTALKALFSSPAMSSLNDKEPITWCLVVLIYL